MSTKQIYALSVGIAVVMAAIIVGNYGAIPDQIPMQFDTGGNVNRSSPKNWLSATAPVWFSLGLILVMCFSTPNPSIAYERADVPADDSGPQIPFSQTAADKAAELLRRTDRTVAWVTLAMAVSLFCIEMVTIFPRLNHLMPVAIAAGVIFVIASLVLAFRLVTTWPDHLKTMPTDEDEKTRLKHFKYGSGIGFYKEPRDPMAAMILPSNESKVQFNMAHRQARGWAIRISAALTALLVLCFLAAIL